MRKVCQSSRALWHPSMFCASLTCGSAGPSCRTARPTTRPVLAKLFGELLASGGPVGADTVAELNDMALEVQFILLEPGDIEFLAGGAALKLAGDIFLVVFDDPIGALLDILLYCGIGDCLLCDDARSTDALGPLRHQEFTFSLYGCVDIVSLIGTIG